MSDEMWFKCWVWRGVKWCEYCRSRMNGESLIATIGVGTGKNWLLSARKLANGYLQVRSELDRAFFLFSRLSLWLRALGGVSSPLRPVSAYISVSSRSSCLGWCTSTLVRWARSRGLRRRRRMNISESPPNFCEFRSRLYRSRFFKHVGKLLTGSTRFTSFCTAQTTNIQQNCV